MKTPTTLSGSSGASLAIRPAIVSGLGKEPVAFGTLKYIYIPGYGNRNVPLQAARGDDDVMSTAPNQR